ncbi:MAG: phosphotransferase enzyme family protein [Thiohalospira sp.]
MESLQSIFEQFDLKGTFKDACLYGSGHINETYLITTKEKDFPSYILQKINPNVFDDIPKMLDNIALVTNYLHTHQKKSQYLQLYKSLDGNNYVTGCNSQFWSAYNFIDGVSHDLVKNDKLALEGGKAWGDFLNQLINFPINQLHITLPGFHHLQLRLNQFYEALQNGNQQRIEKNRTIVNFIQNREDVMLDYQQSLFNSSIPVRLTHNDTKFNNILFDHNDHYMCVIDLGTIMPGYIHYDFGDAIRTICNTSLEDEVNLQKTGFNLSYFKAFAKGYLTLTKQYLLAQELDYLHFSPLFMTYLIGLRFFTDFLQNDKYFKTRNQEHNLQRTKVQFKLLEDMEKNIKSIKQTIKQI